MRESSLTRRAVVAVLVIEFVCALAFLSTALWHEWSTRVRALDVALQGRSDSLIGAVQDAEDPADNVTIDPDEFSAPQGDVYAVFGQGGRLVGESIAAPPELVARGRDGYRNVLSHGHSYRVVQREALRVIDREETAGAGIRRPITVLYAMRTDHLWEEVLEAASFYVVLGLGLLAVTALVLIFFLRRLLHPLQELAVEAAGIRASSLTFKAPPSALHIRELEPLAAALSTTVAGLKRAFDSEHRFISDAAHELKTAVAVVRSSVQVLTMHDRSPEEYRLGLEQVLSDNDRVEELVSRMLTLARFTESADRAAVETDLSERVRWVLNKLASFAGSRRVVFQPSLNGAVKVRMAPEAAEILLSNLVMNAVQHSARGSEVRVSARLAESGERPAVLAVQDFGTGIAPENLPKVFDRFFREDASRSRESGGAGLGLAICKAIAEASGGTIEIQSELGRGTTVTVSFPPA